jgi:ABC-2 type transport system ATP-binding protein/lipopolysaccharide transport system ATP-binding protein
VTLLLPDRRADSTAEPAIVVDDVSKVFRLYKERSSSLKERVTRLQRPVYDKYWALKDVSLTVPRGTTFGLIGHNGSGKSTLLRLMAGIHRPTSGKVHIDGRVSALLELGAGFHPELTGRENIYLNGSILGLNRKTINTKIDEIIDFAGLGEFIDTPVKIYSSGMFVRLGFSVAVHVDPDILIIDEVIAVGDEDFQRRCFDHLYRLRSKGSTIVMVTHSLNLVQQMCDNAAWLDHGELKALGAAPDVVHHYVDQVNVVEAERLVSQEAGAAGEEASIDVEADAAHGLIKLGKVEFLNRDGRPSRVAVPMEPLTIRIHWTSSAPVEEPLFSFAIENEAGVYVANPGMRPGSQAGAPLVGEGYVDYAMDELVLGPGQYSLSVAAHDHSGTTVLDKQMRFVTLRVQPGSHVVNGLVEMMGDWRAPVSTTEAAT